MLENLEPKRVIYFFQEMDKIPRNSGDEKAVSDWICAWAKDQGLSVVQDEIYNLVISKPASPGYENVEPVILQAHIDMVCEKTPQSNHDFRKDPIYLKTDGDWIVSDCGTSIGADNGIGVAYMMAVLEDKTLKHPPIEAIFTVCEESTFDGAKNISPKLYSAKRMINLDNAAETDMLAGSCGGIGMDYTMPISYENAPGNMTFLEVEVSNMEGGHSGEDINNGRGNAIEVLIRLVDYAKVRFASINGGTFRLAIPREAKAVIALPKEKEGEYCDFVKSLSEDIYKEFNGTAPNMKIRVMPAEAGKILTEDSQKAVFSTCKLFPNGIQHMNGVVKGIVESSINMGTVELVDNNLFITAEARGAYRSTVVAIQRKVETMARLFNAKVEYYGDYVPWEYNPNSKLRDLATGIYKDMFGEEIHTVIVHGGIEVAMFMERTPDMDAITIGPNCMYFHSPNERVSIKSTERVWKFLLKILEDMK